MHNLTNKFSIESTIIPPASDITLIGITGHARSGKDTVADYITTKISDSYVLPFAWPLKNAMAWAFGLPLHTDLNHKEKETPDPFWGVSPRQILQFAGTEIFRESMKDLIPGIGHNFWIQRHFGTVVGLLDNDESDSPEYLKFTSGDTIIIPDVRFPNELQYLRQNKALILHLTRPGADGNIGIPGHQSEQNLSAHIRNTDNVYYINNDSTLENLYAQVDHALKSI
jgi:hypothetical protein